MGSTWVKARKQDQGSSGVNGVSGLRGVSRWPRIGHPDRGSVERSIEENGRHSCPIEVIALVMLLDGMAVPGQRFNPWRGLFRSSLGVMLPRRWFISKTVAIAGVADSGIDAFRRRVRCEVKARMLAVGIEKGANDGGYGVVAYQHVL